MPSSRAGAVLARGARPTGGTLLVALLCAALGFATVVQVRAQDETPLDRSRREQLVQILDEVSARSTRLEQEVVELERTRDELRDSSRAGAAAAEQAREREAALQVLSGTVPVRGPGVVVTLTDPRGAFGAVGLLGAVQELRAADAEAIAVGGAGGAAARVVVSTAVEPGDDGGVVVGGVELRSPYRITALGDPAALAGAVRFPRGVLAQVNAPEVGGRATVQERDSILVEAVVPVP